ncbi:hypothetical protein L6452_39418 [Arctium lappa]|uniref:Uncharacterized protein n=1 Tax=Arctium lappa TaxID=4217 RepID=A0ACB8XSX2_ARCLA|nr:hypothetical protein L6452_39418 [Arctium lappa]
MPGTSWAIVPATVTGCHYRRALSRGTYRGHPPSGDYAKGIVVWHYRRRVQTCLKSRTSALFHSNLPPFHPLISRNRTQTLKSVSMYPWHQTYHVPSVLPHPTKIRSSTFIFLIKFNGWELGLKCWIECSRKSHRLQGDLGFGSFRLEDSSGLQESSLGEI